MAKFKELEVGDKVKLDYVSKQSNVGSNSVMEGLVGEVGTILDKNTSYKAVTIDFPDSDDDSYYYKAKWLTKIEEDVVEDATESVKVSEWEYYLESGLESQLSCVQECIHDLAIEAGWWIDINTGESITENPLTFSNKLMLIVSECAEAMEGDRKDLMDDKLPHRKAREVELADAVIRCFDLAGGYGMDLAGAIVEKLKYNQTRPDHTKASRLSSGGKAY